MSENQVKKGGISVETKNIFPDMSSEILGYPFEDVDSESWYTDAVYWARKNGIVPRSARRCRTKDAYPKCRTWS